MGRRTVSVDVVRVGSSVDRQIPRGVKCLICNRGFSDGKQAALRIRDFDQVGVEHYSMHRSCVEELLAAGVVDEDVERFEAYRQKLVDERGLQPIG